MSYVVVLKSGRGTIQDKSNSKGKGKGREEPERLTMEMLKQWQKGMIQVRLQKVVQADGRSLLTATTLASCRGDP